MSYVSIGYSARSGRDENEARRIKDLLKANDIRVRLDTPVMLIIEALKSMKMTCVAPPAYFERTTTRSLPSVHGEPSALWSPKVEGRGNNE